MVLGELGGLSLFHQKNYKRAVIYLEEHLRLARQINDVVHTARALAGLGQLAQSQGDYALATARFVEGLNLFRARGYEWEVIPLLACFADLAVAQQRQERAVRIEAAADVLSNRLNASRPENAQSCEKPSLADLRAALGGPAFDAAWAEGSAMSLDQAIQYTISED
jgi:tetratricopeptide (TPR) repeat protein